MNNKIAVVYAAEVVCVNTQVCRDMARIISSRQRRSSEKFA